MLGRLRMSCDDAMQEYRDLSKLIFGYPRWASWRGPILWPRPKYDEKAIQRAVDDVVKRRVSKETQRQIGGGTNFNSPPSLCKTLVFAIAKKVDKDILDYGEDLDDEERTKNKAIPQRKKVDVEDNSYYVFRSYDHWGHLNSSNTWAYVHNPGPAASLPIWEVSRGMLEVNFCCSPLKIMALDADNKLAITAAPTYFKPMIISNRKFSDGAFGPTNNPAVEMFKECLDMNGQRPEDIKLFLSIGTGDYHVDNFPDEKDVFKYPLRLIKSLTRMALNPDIAHQRMEDLAKNPRKSHDIKYFRLNVTRGSALGKMKMDECKENTLDEIQRMTEEYCETPEVQSKIKEIAEILVEHRHERMSSPYWTHVSTGSQFRCTVPYCRRTQQLLKKKDELKRHIEIYHASDLKDRSQDDYLAEGKVDL